MFIHEVIASTEAWQEERRATGLANDAEVEKSNRKTSANHLSDQLRQYADGEGLEEQVETLIDLRVPELLVAVSKDEWGDHSGMSVMATKDRVDGNIRLGFALEKRVNVVTSIVPIGRGYRLSNDIVTNKMHIHAGKNSEGRTTVTGEDKGVLDINGIEKDQSLEDLIRKKGVEMGFREYFIRLGQPGTSDFYLRNTLNLNTVTPRHLEEQVVSLIKRRRQYGSLPEQMVEWNKAFTKKVPLDMDLQKWWNQERGLSYVTTGTQAVMAQAKEIFTSLLPNV